MVPSITLDVENKHQHIFTNSGLYNSAILNVFEQNPALYMLIFSFILTLIILAMVLTNLFLRQVQHNEGQLRGIQRRLCNGPLESGNSRA